MVFSKKLFYVILLSIFSLALFLTLFECLLYLFHKPIGFLIEDLNTHTVTWTYLLKQEYISFINLDIYNIHEKRHLLDVKRVLELTYQIWLILLIISLMTLVLYKRSYKKLLRHSAILGLSLSGLLLLSSISFLSSFQFLHALLFDAKTWIFPNNSILIELFPLIYFQQFCFFLLVGSMVLFTSLFFFTASRDSKTTD